MQYSFNYLLIKIFAEDVRSAVRHLTVTSHVLITNDTTEEHNQLETSNNLQQIYFGVKTLKCGLSVCCVCLYKSPKSLAKQISSSYVIYFGYEPYSNLKMSEFMCFFPAYMFIL